MPLFPMDKNQMIGFVREQLYQAAPDYTAEQFVDDLYAMTVGNAAVSIRKVPEVYRLRSAYEGLGRTQDYTVSAVRTQISEGRLLPLSREEVHEWTGEYIERPRFFRVLDLLRVPLGRWYHEKRAANEATPQEARSAGRPITRPKRTRRLKRGRPSKKETVTHG